jgi:hypothetical protein
MVESKVKIQTNKNRNTVLIILALSVIPFAIAWYFAEHPQSLRLGTSNGVLVTPLITTQFSEFSGYDAFTADNLAELKGHWVLINPVAKVCEADCEAVLYKTRQISLMMGKDISRIRRAAVLPEKTLQPAFNAELQADGHLLKILAAPGLQDKLLKITGNSAMTGSLVIMDPLGNLMMYYPAGFDPYLVRNDLMKLLKISQIG